MRSVYEFTSFDTEYINHFGLIQDKDYRNGDEEIDGSDANYLNRVFNDICENEENISNFIKFSLLTFPLYMMAATIGIDQPSADPESSISYWNNSTAEFTWKINNFNLSHYVFDDVNNRWIFTCGFDANFHSKFKNYDDEDQTLDYNITADSSTTFYSTRVSFNPKAGDESQQDGTTFMVGFNCIDDAKFHRYMKLGEMTLDDDINKYEINAYAYTPNIVSIFDGIKIALYANQTN